MSNDEKRNRGPVPTGAAEHHIGLRVSEKAKLYLDKSRLGTTATIRLALDMLRKRYPHPRSLPGTDLDAD